MSFTTNNIQYVCFTYLYFCCVFDKTQLLTVALFDKHFHHVYTLVAITQQNT